MTRDQEEKLSEIHRRVVRLDTQLGDRGGVFDRLDALEDRLDKLHTKSAKGIGAIAVIAAIFSACGAALSEKLFR